MPNILLDANLAAKVKESVPGLRAVVKAAVDAGIGVPGFMSILSYFDTYRTARLGTALTQAQRDFFGAHTYERIDDEPGKFFHTEWEA